MKKALFRHFFPNLTRNSDSWPKETPMERTGTSRDLRAGNAVFWYHFAFVWEGFAPKTCLFLPEFEVRKTIFKNAQNFISSMHASLLPQICKARSFRNPQIIVVISPICLLNCIFYSVKHIGKSMLADPKNEVVSTFAAFWTLIQVPRSVWCKARHCRWYLTAYTHRVCKKTLNFMYIMCTGMWK